MVNCRFCSIAKEPFNRDKPENRIIACSNDYFSLASVGALVEGWTLVIPRIHSCSMKDIYIDNQFADFTTKMITALQDSYGPVIAFEHGPNREGSETSCGTDHAHIHLVPFHSIAQKLDSLNLEWIVCHSSEISEIVGENEYLFYCEFEEQSEWKDPIGKVHVLKEPISQFFRRILAQELGCIEKYNYKIYPDNSLTLKTIDRLQQYFEEKAGG